MTRPTPELSRRHEIAEPQIDARAFRPGWRVVSRLDTLHRDGLISLDQLYAARRWQRDYETALERWPCLQLDGLPRASGNAAATPGLRLAAVSRLRAVADALGAFAVAVLVLCVVEDASWPDVARRCGCSAKTAPRWAADVVAALAAYYRDADMRRAARNPRPGTGSEAWHGSDSQSSAHPPVGRS